MAFTRRWRGFLESKPWMNAQALHLQYEDEHGAYIVQPIAFEKIEPSSLMRDAERDGMLGCDLFRDDVEGFLQCLVDLAWENGIRPKGVEDQTGELTATKHHLADMQRLVFEKPTVIKLTPGQED